MFQRQNLGLVPVEAAIAEDIVDRGYGIAAGHRALLFVGDIVIEKSANLLTHS